MTPAEKQVWLALYAAAWFHPTGMPIGPITDAQRAEWCAGQATRALNAARDAPTSGLVSSSAARLLSEVLQ